MDTDISSHFAYLAFLRGEIARSGGVSPSVLRGIAPALDHEVVHPAPLAVHGNQDLGRLERLHEIQAPKVISLFAAEYQWLESMARRVTPRAMSVR